MVLGKGGFTDLLQQDFLERNARHQGIEHELALFFVLGRPAGGHIGLGEVIAPFLVDLDQSLEFSVKFVRRLVRGLLRGGIERDVGWGFRRIGDLRRRAIRVLDFLFLEFRFGNLGLLEDGVLLEFLLDKGLKFQGRRL